MIERVYFIMIRIFRKSEMKRNLILLITIILSMSSINSVYAFQSEPKDFRGIKWGTNISKLKHMMTLNIVNGNYKSYIRKNDSMKIRNADIEKITYGFYDGKFGSVIIDFKGFNNFIALKQLLTENYGNGDKEDWPWESYKWKGEFVNITINCINDKGHIMYFYKPLLKKDDGL